MLTTSRFSTYNLNETNCQPKIRQADIIDPKANIATNTHAFIEAMYTCYHAHNKESTNIQSYLKTPPLNSYFYYYWVAKINPWVVSDNTQAAIVTTATAYYNAMVIENAAHIKHIDLVKTEWSNWLAEQLFNVKNNQNISSSERNATLQDIDNYQTVFLLDRSVLVERLNKDLVDLNHHSLVLLARLSPPEQLPNKLH
ncbi:hypothetical protein NEDG_00769 [Nematocida displodere]|uniref:Uncharacterized protein n=1 Tax=Nematocida displodere TaxID=1805483 RepID=A0A177ED32_9MICR|nr:hypothetical protein NEDG_00769 [Nematocida displodere]